MIRNIFSICAKLRSKDVANSIPLSENENIFVISTRRPLHDNPIQHQSAENITDSDREQQDECILEIEEEPQQPIKLHCVPTFIKKQLDFMFYCGLSPVKGDGSQGSPFQLVF